MDTRARTRWMTTAVALLLSPACRAALLVEYTFNEATSGTTPALNTGTASGGTLSFKNDATRTASAPTAPHNPFTHVPLNVAALDLTQGVTPSLNDSAQAGAAISALNSLPQLTVSFWINLRATPQQFDRILETSGGLRIWITGSSSQQLSGTIPVPANAFYVRVDRNSGNGHWLSPTSMNANQAWLFVAVAVNFSGNSTTYFVGNETTAVSSLGAGTAGGDGATAANSGATTSFILGDFTTGNSATDRTPPAWIDSFRIHNSLLTLAQIEALRQSDLLLQAIPEPASLAVLLVLGAAAWRRHRPGRRPGELQ